MLNVLLIAQISIALFPHSMVPTCGGEPFTIPPITSEGQYFYELFCRDDSPARISLPFYILSFELFRDRLLSDHDESGQEFQRLPLLEAVNFQNIPAVILLLLCGNHADAFDPIHGWRPIDVAYEYAFSGDDQLLGTRYGRRFIFRLLLFSMSGKVREKRKEDYLVGTAIQFCKHDYQYGDIAGFIVNGIPSDGRRWNLSGRCWLAVHTEKRDSRMHVFAWMLSDDRDAPVRMLMDADFEFLHGHWILVKDSNCIQSPYIHDLLVREQSK